MVFDVFYDFIDFFIKDILLEFFLKDRYLWYKMNDRENSLLQTCMLETLFTNHVCNSEWYLCHLQD